MTAEVLRRAAALMRERAEAQAGGPWFCYGDHLVWPGEAGPAANDPIAEVGEAHEGAADYIASWHPAVALAVADWLDKQAVIASWGEHVGRGPVDDTVKAALVVARAYLGDPA